MVTPLGEFTDGSEVVGIIGESVLAGEGTIGLGAARYTVVATRRNTD